MSLLEGSVKLPEIGEVKKTYVAAAVILTVGAGIWYTRHRKASGLAASNTSGTTGTDPAGNVGVINPLTGYVTGSAEDLAASGSQTYQPYTGGGGGGGGSDSSGSVDTQVTNGPPFTNNAAWTQYAIQKLAANAPDLDPTAVTADLGAYLAGAQVTPDQAAIIRQAEAVAGPVPVASTTGFPPSINMVGSPAGPGSTPPAPVTNLKAAVSGTSVKLTWSAATGATGYAWQVGSKTGTSTTTSVTVGGLAPGTQYVATVDSTGPGGASTPATATFSTAAAVPAPPKTPGPTYVPVTVEHYTSSNPPWQATISGIAGHYHTTAPAVWNDPKNAALKKLRGAEDLIRAGDIVYVRIS